MTSPSIDACVADDQPHDGQAGHALAGAGLAHDAEHLAGLERERDAVDGLDEAVLGREVDLEVLHLEQRLALHSRVPHPRVEEGVDDVDDEVRDDDEEAAEDRHAHDGGKSSLKIAWSVYCPMPGMLKTVSVMIAPPSKTRGRGRRWSRPA